jgi:dTMP kinase
MFIVFEGIDGSGKSTLSKAFADAIGYEWTHEPTFSSEYADSLNLGSKNDIQREVEFMLDRITHMQELLGNTQNIVCDRYIWTGLAYCKRYNPSAYPFAEAVYMHKFFRNPDYYVYVETPIQVCFERKRTQPVEHLENLDHLYRDLIPKISGHSKVIMTKGVGNIEDTIVELKKAIIN